MELLGTMEDHLGQLAGPLGVCVGETRPWRVKWAPGHGEPQGALETSSARCPLMPSCWPASVCGHRDCGLWETHGWSARPSSAPGSRIIKHQTREVCEGLAHALQAGRRGHWVGLQSGQGTHHRADPLHPDPHTSPPAMTVQEMRGSWRDNGRDSGMG